MLGAAIAAGVITSTSTECAVETTPKAHSVETTPKDHTEQSST